MKWHKISDGDYPEIGRYVLVAWAYDNGEYNESYTRMAKLERDFTWNDDGYVKWGTELTDCWAYIDLSTD